MMVVGRRVIPWVLHYVAHTGSRELFRLAVLAIALGVAFGASELFDISFALGAFLAGMILAESQLSQRAAQETLPLRDAFAVLFFVSVGMLFDPTVLLRQPMLVGATFLIIVVGNALAVSTLALVFRYPLQMALALAASLAQIGEFSFILAGLGVELKLLPEAAYDLTGRRDPFDPGEPVAVRGARTARAVAGGAGAKDGCRAGHAPISCASPH
jgi:CPA2 family monovalent cation:H+ antiporter-2